MQINLAIDQPQSVATLLAKRSILKVLAYFDMFSYPLTRDEIRLFLDCTVSNEQLDQGLCGLLNEQRIFCNEQFYTLRNEPSLTDRRKNGNSKAAQLLQKAKRISGFLYLFPYVRGIGISGSLSKNFAGENADIDFFIITQSNRLWVARTFMHIFKKLTFLVGRQHWFCMNYYVDQHALQIHEKNIFTATEVITLVPAEGNGVLTSFFKANNWVSEYFPNQPAKTGSPIKPKERVIKRFIEYCLDNKLGDWLDDYLLNLTSRRWRKKEMQGKRNARGGRMGLFTDKHFARPNPEFFQQKILAQYQSKLEHLVC
jgi:hypothetical protein